MEEPALRQDTKGGLRIIDAGVGMRIEVYFANLGYMRGTVVEHHVDLEVR